MGGQGRYVCAGGNCKNRALPGEQLTYYIYQVSECSGRARGKDQAPRVYLPVPFVQLHVTSGGDVDPGCCTRVGRVDVNGDRYVIGDTPRVHGHSALEIEQLTAGA